MINQTSIDQVNSSRFSQGFTKPLYDSYCFANIPETISAAFTGNRSKGLPNDVLPQAGTAYSKVVFLFIDAFGWDFFNQRQKNYPALQRFVETGVVSQLTSQFPSTTAAHVTSIHTGLSVGQSGIYEWNYYEPLLDEIITPLLFSHAGTKERNTLMSTGISPQALYPTTTLHQELGQAHVRSRIFTPAEFSDSPYNQVVTNGCSERIAYKSLPHGLTTMRRALLADNEPTYYFFYYGAIDTAGHSFGPSSEEFHDEIDTFLTTLERLLFDQIDTKLSNTLILMSADHGQTAVNPQTTIYLNREVPQLAEMIVTNKQGRLIVPAGSCRDMFLHIKPSQTEGAITLLRDQLKGKAEVYPTDELIKQGFFGAAEPSPTFLSRVGNVVILPYSGESVWWYEQDKFDMRYFGHHGGLTPEEMTIPLLALEL